MDEVIRFRAPKGFGEVLASAAAVDCSNVSELVRRAVLKDLRERGVAFTPPQPKQKPAASRRDEGQR